MTDEQLWQIENRALSVDEAVLSEAVEWYNPAGAAEQDFADNAPNDVLALVAEAKALRAKLDAVPVYVAGVVGAAPLVSFEDFYTFVTGIGTDTDTSADGLVIPDDGGDE